jgi:hypothetical protein
MRSDKIHIRGVAEAAELEVVVRAFRISAD